MKAVKIVPCILLVCLYLSGQVHAGEVEVFLQKGSELYCTHHLAPDRFDEAIGWYEKALALEPGEYSILWKLSEMYQVYGIMLGEEQRKKKAALWEKGIEYGKRAVEANPDGKEGHFYYMANLGALARLQGALTSVRKFRKIKKEMARALELDPDYAPALVARAQYLTEMPAIFGGDEQEARHLYQRALQSDPGYVIAYYYLAELDVRRGRYDEAIANLDRVLQTKETACMANWSTIDRPWAEKLLDQIAAKRDARK